MSKAAGGSSPGKWPIRTGVRFETGADRCAHLNRIQAVGIGVADFECADGQLRNLCVEVVMSDIDLRRRSATSGSIAAASHAKGSRARPCRG
jgi:hypothetical protein